MERYVVNGLDLRPINELAQQIADEGFNCVRLPYSLEQFYLNPIIDSVAVSANPSMFGLSAMEVFDLTVDALTTVGLAVILNNHMSDAAWCCSDSDRNGLWHNQKYSSDSWVDAVISVAMRYEQNLLVVGNDLRNEIRPDLKNRLYASWGDGDIKTDWKLAATDCGNQLLESLPHQLIIVEGLNYANTMSMIKESPIQLQAPNKLVYSFHMYSWQSVTSFDTYSAFVEGLTTEVAYILEQGQPWTAPLWLGEFGDNIQDNYWNFTVKWLSENPEVGFAYWAWNGYQHTPSDEESYGILNADMATVRDAWKLQDLQSLTILN